MVLLGAHMSIAGGYFRAVERAQAAGCDVVQCFTKNNNQWRAKPISDNESRQFRESLRDLKISHPLSHSSYLLNLASPDEILWEKSIAALVVELERADQLGIPYVVIHPGACMAASEEAGIDSVVRALVDVLRRTAQLECGILLETTAGQGSSLGHSFEQLAALLKGTRRDKRLGVCFDTCHVFAAGYPMGQRKEYRRTMGDFDRLVGVDQIKAFHLNDSKKDLGSRVDRHEHIGRGKMGLEPFRNLLNDKRFRRVPLYLETPKGIENGEELDVVNLRTLRGLITARKRSE